MTYLVDSDWVADYLKGRAVAHSLLDTLVLDGMAISIVTYAEVLEGIYDGHEPVHHERVFRQFLHAVRVLGVTRRYAVQSPCRHTDTARR